MTITPEELAKLCQQIPPPKAVFYRLYYNSDGSLICYSMEDLPGKYIEIDSTTYVNGKRNIRVVDGRIVEIVPKSTVKKLHPGNIGTTCDPKNVCVVVHSSNPHINWSVKTSEVD